MLHEIPAEAASLRYRNEGAGLLSGTTRKTYARSENLLVFALSGLRPAAKKAVHLGDNYEGSPVPPNGSMRARAPSLRIAWWNTAAAACRPTRTSIR